MIREKSDQYFSPMRARDVAGIPPTIRIDLVDRTSAGWVSDAVKARTTFGAPTDSDRPAPGRVGDRQEVMAR